MFCVPVRREKGNLSSEQGGQTSDRKHMLKVGPHYHTSQWTHEDVTAFMMSCFCGGLFLVIVVVCEQKREKVLRRSASCGPLRGEMEETKEEERWCLAPDCPDSSSTVQAAGGLDTRALTTRYTSSLALVSLLFIIVLYCINDSFHNNCDFKELNCVWCVCPFVHVHIRRKHRLCVNDRVVLERRTRGEERRRGAVRFIGPLENTESRDIYIGVELDTASEFVCVCARCVCLWCDITMTTVTVTPKILVNKAWIQSDRALTSIGRHPHSRCFGGVTVV